MNYEKIYNSLIVKRQQVEILPDDAIFEQHHIIPRSIRPDLISEPSNIVRLTLKEHFVCHQLLVRIYAQKYGENSSEHIKMVNALFIMSGYKRYGKMLSPNQYATLKLKYRENIGDILRQAWKNYPKVKMDKLRAKRRINASGSKNPMFGRSWKEGKTNEEILQHSIKTSIGLRNRTEEQKRIASQKMREAYMKRTIEQKQETNQKRIASRKRFYSDHPDKLKEKSEKIGRARQGMRKLFKEGEQPIWVRAVEIQTYLDNGWKYSLHEPDKTNAAYGRKWMHIRGSDRKEDRIYVKQEDVERYLKQGYVFGIKDKSKIRAKNEDGILTVTLPFKKEELPEVAQITVE